MKARRAAAQAVRVASAFTDLLIGRRAGPRVLIYHEIGGASDRELNLSPASFQFQVEWMLGNGRIVSLSEGVNDLTSIEASNRFVLTFDDGYLGVWRHAFPVLRDLSAPFTLYLTTSPLETGAPLHSGADQPLTWEAVRTMVESGLVTLGAHTHSHPDLRFTTQNEVRDELETSDALIESRTGQRPRHFAYPWGYWSESAHSSVRDRYETAALGSGPADTQGLNQGRFHRVPVLASDGAWVFQRRMYGGFRLEDRVRRRLKRYTGP